MLPRSPGLLLTLNVDRLYGRLPGHKAWDGRVTIKVLDEDRYQDSVYGWAGTVGEAIERDRPNAVEVAWKRYECSRQTLSDTDLLSARQQQALTARFWAQARRQLTRRRRLPRSCPRVVRQPVRGWPRKTRNQSWQGSLTFQILAPKR